MDPYYLLDQLESEQWNFFYKEQAELDKQREKAKYLDSLFPTHINDFNPNDIKYCNYLNDEFTQESYSDFVSPVVAHNSNMRRV